MTMGLLLTYEHKGLFYFCCARLATSKATLTTDDGNA